MWQKNAIDESILPTRKKGICRAQVRYFPIYHNCNKGLLTLSVDLVSDDILQMALGPEV